MVSRLQELDVWVFERGPELDLPDDLQPWWHELDRHQRRQVYELARSEVRPVSSEEGYVWAAVLRARAAALRQRTPAVRRVTMGSLLGVAGVLSLAAGRTAAQTIIAMAAAAAIGLASTAGREREAARLDAQATMREADGTGG